LKNDNIMLLLIILSGSDKDGLIRSIENELLETVANTLLKKEIALITRNRKLIDILTEIDILQYTFQRKYYLTQDCLQRNG